MKTVKTQPLKEYALKKMPRNSHLRELILTEKDVLTAEEFLTLMRVWLRLFNIEQNRKS